uniref:Amine oxidase n=1 Tax=Pseudo-nitzschia australis TaxID=44445 RepID=A0A6V0AJ18_9STRA|mmetsp:Transcript_19464/g.42293  ORF Transcript_19464/g.42293 Transcript_19464/m.42293 type:complete len:618 (+) Transcript_19464:369-2222(+)|eukprot:CAMPEP_0168174394 /NCGR_PEP_ID=MMETSP0139_2-20121125/6471_1 /TAXON_ID=44445 /ORGANISM="Pseudo-nitzschia australis, Strain 10249 10 AB" /LENGTH=617 /DNA_ID=CAMNT_0008092523 /DNA_START=383 /DNA_END=2236 /DNA_ORIENTATION=+
MKWSSSALFALLAGVVSNTQSAYGFAPYTPVNVGSSIKSSSSNLVMKDFPKPNVENTDNYRLFNELSSSFNSKLKITDASQKKKVAIIGGGLSGLACAKYLSDAGHEPVVYEARDVLGGKVSAWQDADGDWIETGLHIFFGAYPNMMNLFDELDIHDRLQWKIHQMIFAMQELPGEFTTFDFIPGIPAPFNFGLAILMNQKMLTLGEKIQTAPPLLPMLIEGQPFIDAQDELSVTDFMRKYGMPERINSEVFIAMAKALDFIDPDKLSMTVVLTAMNRFLNEDNGLQMAFLDGNQPDRLCAPMKEHIEARGGSVIMNSPIKEIVVDEADGKSIKHLLLRSGEEIVADEYVSAMPVDIVKRMTPKEWQQMPYFRQFDELEGIPVINLHMWFDRKLKAVDHLCFSRSPLLSVYADMSVTCKEYYDPNASMLELVFAPCSPIAGGNTNWISKTDEQIIDATMGELARLFPTEIAADDKWPSTKDQGPNGQARLRKYSVVKVPRSVYAAIPGRNKFRPGQRSPIPNLTMGGDWTSQKFLGSMEGAVLGGKLAAEVVAKKAKGMPLPEFKEIQQNIVDKAKDYEPKTPWGVKGEGAIAFGAGATLTTAAKDLLKEVDPVQFA